jgi:hypothetical protein
VELSSFREILNKNDVAFAVKTDGRHFSFVEGGVSSSGLWPLDENKTFNKVVIFHSGENGNIYIGDFVSADSDGDKYFLSFSNSKLAGVSKVNWTTFTEGKSGGYSRIYLNGGNKKPPGNKKPKKKTVTVDVYERDAEVKEWILSNANGSCESCLNTPFLLCDGTPFLEVHHVKRLADGGSDTTSNTVALCPNCHRELHYGINSNDKLSKLYQYIDRLVRE